MKPDGSISRRTFREQAGQGAETRPKRPAVDAPPEHADRHGDRVSIGHAGTQDAAGRPQGDPAEPEAEGARIEPATERARGRLPSGGPAPVPTPLGEGQNGCVPSIG